MYKLNKLKKLSLDERALIVKYLYKMAKIDYKIVEEEKKLINEIKNELDVEIKETDLNWTIEDNNLLKQITKKSERINAEIYELINKVMEADHIEHHNEKREIIKFMSNTLGAKSHIEAKIVPLLILDESLTKMLNETADLCEKKASNWQKKKATKQKKVAASLSWEENGGKRFVTAVNYELSTPGGSRCAEQNAIGMAIANNPKLQFKDVRDIVVYGSGGLSNPLYPCGVCQENLRKLNINNQIKVYTYPNDYDHKNGELPTTVYEMSLKDILSR
jgi:cytidine deaminase